MANFAEAFKAEITRLARKEMKREIAALRKSTASQRGELASLRKEVRSLAQSLKKSARARPSKPTEETGASKSGTRFSAKGLASTRRRLGLSAEQFAQLIQASSQSVYNWEAGKAQPRAAHVNAIASLRGVGKREVARRLATTTK